MNILTNNENTYTFIFSSNLFFSDYHQSGFSAGFQAGYCHGVISGCVSPVAPIGPVDIKNDYQTGYNNGFVVGKQQRQTSDTKSGGAYGQLKPTDNKVGDVYQNMVNNIISNRDNSKIQQAWEDYYWRKEEKRQAKEDAKNNLIALYDKEFTITNEMILALENENNSSDDKFMIESFKERNLSLIYKYRKTKNFTSYFKKLLELRNEIRKSNKNL